MPPQMRTSSCSWAICAKLSNLRERRASEVSVATKLSVPLPKTASRTPRAAPALIPACDGYSGCIGVVFSRIVAVLVAVADRSDRSPEIVLEFGVPIDDEAIGESHGHQCEHARAFGYRQVMPSGSLPGRLEPCGPKVGLCPEPHGVGLCVGPLRAFRAAHFPGFVVIA